MPGCSKKGDGDLRLNALEIASTPTVLVIDKSKGDAEIHVRDGSTGQLLRLLFSRPNIAHVLQEVSKDSNALKSLYEIWSLGWIAGWHSMEMDHGS